MKCYIITYDLVKNRDYTRLYEALKTYKTWARINDSTWAIVTSQNYIEIRDFLLKYIDKDDKLFVIKSGGLAAWSNVDCSSDWLTKYITMS